MSNLAPKSATAGKIDALAVAILEQLELVDMPLVHRFTPGLYSREIFMRAGIVVVSKIHNTEHQFAILEGAVDVFTEADGVQRLRAPHVGITKPGTQRVLQIREDCRWVTFHPLVEGESSEADLPKIEARIIEPSGALADGTNVFARYVAKLREQALAGDVDTYIAKQRALDTENGGTP